MNRKSGFDARKYMEMAVEVMRQSVCEPRQDGKKLPKVGAVLVKPDGKVETACRCELRDGDHAEYTLIERKNRSSKLDGCVLFATLEPCAPNSRHEPKMSCAERIVLARINEVWVGIEDPDPMVDRRGIKYLQDNNVRVFMFDRDLQEIIESENEEFIEQAWERASDLRETTKDIKLSTLEDAVDEDIGELERDALEIYRSRAEILDEVGSPAFNHRLVLQGLFEQDGNRLRPTGFGLLLFGKEPRMAMSQAGLIATIHYPDGTEEIQNFEGPQVLVPEQALAWLKERLPTTIDRSEAQRRETSKEFLVLVREAIVNALVHRDYAIAGAKCQLIVESGTIKVMSPGKPVPPITLDQMSSFDAPMLSRNPVMHYIFAKMKLAEERGLGLRSMRVGARQAGLPPPQYSWNDPYLVLTLYQTAEAAITSLLQDVRNSLTEAEYTGWRWLTSQGRAKSSEYANGMAVDGRTARRHLNHFVELGLVRKNGSGPSTDYEVSLRDVTKC